MDTIDIPESQIAQLHDVADLLLEIYHTLVRMRYLRAEWIDEGPHDLTALIPLYESLKLDPAIIYLYHILPYVNNEVVMAERHDFFQGGRFLDFRKPHDVEQARDPFYEAETEGCYPPQAYMTALTYPGDGRDAIIYSSRHHCIWIRDWQCSGSGSDPGWKENLNWPRNEDGTATAEGRKLGYEDISPDIGIDNGTDRSAGVYAPASIQPTQTDINAESSQSAPGSIASGDEAEDPETPATSVEGGDDEQDEDDDEMDWSDDGHEDDRLATFWSPWDARPADTVLRDIDRWYKELRETPGGGDDTSLEWDAGTMRLLYRKHGWPGQGFDGDALEVDWIRANAVREHNQSSLLEMMFESKKHHQDPDSDTNCQVRDLQADDDSTVDDRWHAHWLLAIEERRWLQTFAGQELRLSDECQNGLCGLADELPFLEVAELEERVTSGRQSLEYRQREVQNLDSRGELVPARTRSELSWSEEQVGMHQRALNEAKAHAESLHPGKTVSLVKQYVAPWPTYWASLRNLRAAIEAKQADTNWALEWLKQLPESTDATRQIVEGWIAEKQKDIGWDEKALGNIEERPHPSGPETDPGKKRHTISSCDRCREYFNQREAEWQSGQQF